MSKDSIQVRELILADIPDCEKILYSLPDWFGKKESNHAYIESLSKLPGAVAVINGLLVGFIAVIKHTSNSYEIHVMAVDASLHRNGIGKVLVRWAESWCIEKGISWLHVKTRGPSTPDPGYNRTRLFYLDQGFEPLFESLTLWGSQDAALIMVKHLTCLHDRKPLE